MQERDLAAYSANPAHAEWPGGAQGAVSLVLDVEEGSERAVSRSDLENEPIYDMIDQVRRRADPTGRARRWPRERPDERRAGGSMAPSR